MSNRFNAGIMDLPIDPPYNRFENLSDEEYEEQMARIYEEENARDEFYERYTE